MNTGKISGVIRSMRSSVSRGSSPVISATRFCTICSATTMSVEAANCAEISDAPDPGHRHDHLLDRAGDDQRHRLRRQRARVRDDDDAGELQRRVDAAGQAIGGDDAADYQRRRQQANGARMLQRLAGDVHVDEPFSGAPRAGSFSFSPAGSPSTLIAASSGSPAWPSTITWSPALIPDRISTLVPSLSPIWTGRRLAFVPLATKTA